MDETSMPPALMCDALDDVRSADPFAIDVEIEVMCHHAAMWLWQVETCARALGLTSPEGIERLRPRIYTGYMPKAARIERRHNDYCNGLRTPKDNTQRALEAMR